MISAVVSPVFHSNVDPAIVDRAVSLILLYNVLQVRVSVGALIVTTGILTFCSMRTCFSSLTHPFFAPVAVTVYIPGSDISYGLLCEEDTPYFQLYVQSPTTVVLLTEPLRLRDVTLQSSIVLSAPVASLLVTDSSGLTLFSFIST